MPIPTLPIDCGHCGRNVGAEVIFVEGVNPANLQSASFKVPATGTLWLLSTVRRAGCKTAICPGLATQLEPAAVLPRSVPSPGGRTSGAHSVGRADVRRHRSAADWWAAADRPLGRRSSSVEETADGDGASMSTSSQSPRATSRTDIAVSVGLSGRIAPPSAHDDACDRKAQPPTEHDDGSRPSGKGDQGLPPTWVRRHGDRNRPS